MGKSERSNIRVPHWRDSQNLHNVRKSKESDRNNGSEPRLPMQDFDAPVVTEGVVSSATSSPKSGCPKMN